MRGMVLETAARAAARDPGAEFQLLFDETVRFWRSWLAPSTYTGRWRETLERSAITLKLMTYAPSGGLVAAPTAACPSRSAASATGTTATPGSGTLLLRLRPARHGFHRGGGAFSAVAGEPGAEPR